jgi:PAS domain S-box-containing protein
MVDKAVPDNPGEDEFAQLARKACLIVGRLHDAVHKLIDNEIELAGLPFLPEDATDEINEAILELVTDLIYALPENQNSCLTEGLPQIVELWRKSQKIKLAPGLSRAHPRVVGRSPIVAAQKRTDPRLRAQAATVGVVSWSCPPSGLHVEPQPDWVAFTGMSAEETRGYGWTKAVHPEDFAAWATAWREGVRRGEPFGSEHRVRRHDGEWRWMSARALPVRDDSGETVEWCGVNIDVTDRKAAEAALRESEERLRRISEADRSKDEFLATLAQELRNALASVRNGLEPLRKLSTNEPSVTPQVDHLVRLVDDLMDMSCISRKFAERPPRLDAATTDAPAPQSTPPRLEAGRRVLVIDDLPDVAQSLAFLLKVLGAEVRIAHSGAEGLQICAEFEPELVFLDLSMPEMDGFETARRMREFRAGRRAKLMALTGFGEEPLCTQMQEAGFAGHLSKPARLSQLEKLIASVSAEMA